MTKIVELRPDKGLMDPDFEKYQFSGNEVPVLERKLETEALRLEPTASQDSWLEARLFAFHNHLYKNPYNETCWFVNTDAEIWQMETDGTVQRVHVLRNPVKDSSEPKYNPSISFASEKITVSSNGHKNMEICFGNAPGQLETFTVNDVEPGVILDSVYVEEKSELIVVICGIFELEGKKQSQLTLYSYRSVKVDRNVGETKVLDWEFARKRVLRIKGAVEYVNLERNGTSLHIVSPDSAVFVYDSENLVESEQVASESEAEINIPKYCWSQDETSLTVWLKVPEGSDQKHVKVDISPKSISIKCQDTVLISGESGHSVEAGLTTWSWEKDSLKVDLIKSESGLMWNELIKGDTGGGRLPNEALTAEIHSRLAHLCTDQPDSREGGQQLVLGFNSEQLEECDVEGKENILQRINLETHKTMSLAMLGANRVLFTHKLKYGQALCVRYDHDGCVWSPGECDEDCGELKHRSTFPGFGYVEASKANRKFCVASPDGSYVAIVEHVRHIFIYRKPSTVSHVGEQQLVDLGGESSPIIGATASTQYLNLLTKDKLYRLQVKP